MAEVEQRIVREYFEGHGFLVRQLESPPPDGRRKNAGERADLLVFNPNPKQAGREPGFMIFANDLPYLERAVVAVRGGRAWRFTPATLKSSQRLLRFLEQTVVAKSLRSFPVAAPEDGGEARRLLVLPSLPTSDPHRSTAEEMLRSAGVDGILSFRSILFEVIGRIGAANRDAEKSEVLETIRILKNYDLIKDPQMELFGSTE